MLSTQPHEELGGVVTTNVILDVREKPGTAAALLEGVHIIGAVRVSLCWPAPNVTCSDER